MTYDYAVVGAGRQGQAAAYDLVMFGDAATVRFVDVSDDAAHAAAALLNRLVGRAVADAAVADARDVARLRDVLDGRHAILSAAHYAVNLGLTRLAIDMRLPLVDLGGHTGVVRQQQALRADAQAAGVAIVPDCGMGPGLNVSLAAYVMAQFDTPHEVRIWDGGLPQNPQPPWNYASTFAMSGLTNEYAGMAYFLRQGVITEVPCFADLEELDFAPPIGRLEAFVTSGGLSTAPWTWEGQLRVLENKTLRYPGHCAMFQAFAHLGMLGQVPIDVHGAPVVPRDVLHALLEPRIGVPAGTVQDVCVMRVTGRGERSGHPGRFTVELVDRFDESTGFTAMQRLTGWHAAIVLGLAVRSQLPTGVQPVESIPGALVVAEGRRRGWHITETSPRPEVLDKTRRYP